MEWNLHRAVQTVSNDKIREARTEGGFDVVADAGIIAGMEQGLAQGSGARKMGFVDEVMV